MAINPLTRIDRQTSVSACSTRLALRVFPDSAVLNAEPGNAGPGEAMTIVIYPLAVAG